MKIRLSFVCVGLCLLALANAETLTGTGEAMLSGENQAS